MPTTVILKGGGQLIAKGDSTKTAVHGNPLHPFWLFAVALNGRGVQFKRCQRIAYVFQPDAEWQAEQDNAKAAQAKQTEDQAKAEKDKDASLEKAAEAFIAKYGPDKANWPENLRPKAPAEAKP